MKDLCEFEELYARLEDIKKRAVRGEVGISAFLSPRESHYASIYLKQSGAQFFLYGGYRDAERKRMYILPSYMEGISSVKELAEYDIDSATVAVRAKGSGFCRLAHKDFMGSLLGLGIDRSVIGDIITLSDNEALVICDLKISDFLINEWNSAGRDRIKCTSADLDENFSVERKYLQINDTLASERLDCVVAALCNLSREKARECVVGGLCELDYEQEIRPDRSVPDGALISVRGYGKFKVFEIGGQTKKGRLRLSAGKFV